MKYKKYKKDFKHSYALGSFTVLNLINSMPYMVEAVCCHEKLSQNSLQLIKGACLKHNIPFFENANKEVERVRNKDREFVFATFNKYTSSINSVENHIVLDRPSDMGNLGSIMRTALGFHYKNIVIIGQGADPFHPKTIRASMGAIFDLSIQQFDTVEDYLKVCSDRDRRYYCFMLGGDTELRDAERVQEVPHSLIFGNESTGLDEKYKKIGSPIYIKHSDKIDSLNLGIAVSIAMYNFSS